MSTMLPVLFLSHGAPSLPFEDNPSRRFLADLGESFAKPRAVVVVSAHWQTREVRVTGSAEPATIHDFYGFDQALYAMQYRAPGAPELAAAIRTRLSEAGFAAAVDDTRGLDHGVWSPLHLMLPDADVPTLQVSLQLGQGPQHHFELGRALADLRREGVLVIGSGGAVHNLGVLEFNSTRVPAPAARFDDWLVARVLAEDHGALFAYRQAQGDAAWAHPSEEHLLPLFVAMGAGGRPKCLHRAFQHGGLAMTAFAFQ